MLLSVSSLPPSSQHTPVGERVLRWWQSRKELLSGSHSLNSTHRSILLFRTMWACDVPAALGILSEREWVLDPFDKSKTTFSGSSFRDTINIQPVHVREAVSVREAETARWCYILWVGFSHGLQVHLGASSQFLASETPHYHLGKKSLAWDQPGVEGSDLWKERVEECQESRERQVGWLFVDGSLLASILPFVNVLSRALVRACIGQNTWQTLITYMYNH